MASTTRPAAPVRPGRPVLRNLLLTLTPAGIAALVVVPLLLLLAGCGSVSFTAGGRTVTVSGPSGPGTASLASADLAPIRVKAHPGIAVRGVATLDAQGKGTLTGVAGQVIKLHHLRHGMRKLPASWVKFDGPVNVPASTFTKLTFNVIVPPGTPAGRYQSWIWVTAGGPASGTSTPGSGYVNAPGESNTAGTSAIIIVTVLSP